MAQQLGFWTFTALAQVQSLVHTIQQKKKKKKEREEKNRSRKTEGRQRNSVRGEEHMLLSLKLSMKLKTQTIS